MPEDLAGRGRREAGEHAQERRLAGAGGSEEGEDLSGAHREIGRGDDLDAIFAGLAVVLFDTFGADNGWWHAHLQGQDLDQQARSEVASRWSPLSVSSGNRLECERQAGPAPAART